MDLERYLGAVFGWCWRRPSREYAWCMNYGRPVQREKPVAGERLPRRMPHWSSLRSGRRGRHWNRRRNHQS